MTQRIELEVESRFRQAPEASLDELRGDLARVGCVGPGAGIRSGYHFDKYLLETRPTLLRRVARLLSGLISPNTERLVTRVPGAIAVGVAVSLEIGLPLVIVRPGGSSCNDVRLEGELYEGERVALVEDVVATGSRALAGVGHATAAGAVVGDVLAVLDREQGATERFAEHGLGYHHLFRSSDLGIDEHDGAGERGR